MKSLTNMISMIFSDIRNTFPGAVAQRICASFFVLIFFGQLLIGMMIVLSKYLFLVRSI